MGRKPRKRRQAQTATPEPAGSPPAAPATSLGKSRRLGAPAAGVLLIGLAVWFLRPGAPAGPSPVRREPGLSILLITIDTLRADALGSYGALGAETTWLDRVAAGGVRFERAYAHNTVTLPSHANILSGRYPLEHGIRDNSGFRFPSDMATLATTLAARGYRTGAFVSAFAVDSRFGLDVGFEVYDDSFVNVDQQDAFLMQERPGVETVARAKDWLDGVGNDPFFLWVHVYDPHFPYQPPPEFEGRFATAYHGEVAATDAALAPLLEPLLRAGADGRTLLAVTADHGESLGEHGESTHGIFAYDATLRVPLLLFAPRLLEPRVVSGVSARHIDMFPTLLDAIGEPPDPSLPGRSLLEAANGHEVERLPSYFEALTGMLGRGWAPLHGLRQDPYKLIDLPIPELYDVSTDPGEERNLIGEMAARASALKTDLGGLLDTSTPIEPGDETAETRARLEALGYISSSATPMRSEYTVDDDPKRLIDLDTMLKAIVTLQIQGRTGEALELAHRLIERRPTMTASLKKLAFLQRAVGDLDGSVATLKRSLTVNPADATTQALLGAYLNEAGRSPETVELLGVFVDRDAPDGDVLTAYGIGLAQTGRFEEAIEAFTRARESDPSNAMVLVNMATVDLMRDENARARERLLRAIEINPTLARAHNSLGVIALRKGDTEEAVARWKRAIELDSDEFDTLFNLGTLLLRQGRAPEARPFLERFVATAPAALYARDIERMRALLTGS